ncbi:MAG: permease [Gemmatimonadetes bacterium]|nr:MAG: permease [Gemmatimonadota bacterium]PHX96491.1 MAG: permease [Gemmatimonadota bacterium]
MIWGFAALIGVSLGLLGGGGSVLTVPVFVYAAGFDPKMAIAMSYPVVGIASLVGAISHWRAGHVATRVALPFGFVTMVGAVAGARLAALVSGATQLAILAIAIVAAAMSMLRRGPAATDQESTVAGTLANGTVASGPTTMRLSLIVVGLGVGVLTGLIGIGGGFLIVPALIVLARVPIHSAVGTSLVVIAMNSATAFTAHPTATSIPLAFVSAFTAVAIVGSLAGSRAARIVPAAALRRAFAALLLIVGGAILYQSRVVLYDAFGNTTALWSAP